MSNLEALSTLIQFDKIMNIGTFISYNNNEVICTKGGGAKSWFFDFDPPLIYTLCGFFVFSMSSSPFYFVWW